MYPSIIKSIIIKTKNVVPRKKKKLRLNSSEKKTYKKIDIRLINLLKIFFYF